MVWLIYPADVRRPFHERQRLAVRKAINALRRDRVEGVWVIREGEGSEERARADLTKWTGRYLTTPRHRDRRPVATASSDVAELVRIVSGGVQRGDVILVMSNGSFGGFIPSLLSALRERGGG